MHRLFHLRTRERFRALIQCSCAIEPLFAACSPSCPLCFHCLVNTTVFNACDLDAAISWILQEPWTAGHDTAVAVGPKGEAL
jgi:hypothetical protein